MPTKLLPSRIGLALRDLHHQRFIFLIVLAWAVIYLGSMFTPSSDGRR